MSQFEKKVGSVSRSTVGENRVFAATWWDPNDGSLSTAYTTKTRSTKTGVMTFLLTHLHVQLCRMSIALRVFVC